MAARVTVAGPDGERETWEADYVVGCDGARSAVREQIGIARGGADFDQLMVLAVFRSRELHEGLKRFPDRSTYHVLRPELKGYWQFFGRIDVGEGFFFHAPVPAGTTRENYDFLGLLHERRGLHVRVRIRPCRLLGFARRGGRRLSRRPRLHRRRRRAQPSALWRLRPQQRPRGCRAISAGSSRRVLQGWGGETLLQSYSDERRPIFKETGEDFIAGRIEADGEFLERYNPERDRAEFERAWKERAGGMGERMMSYEPNYEGSPVVAGPPGGKNTAHGTHSYAARAGHHLAPQPLSSGRECIRGIGTGLHPSGFRRRDAAVRGSGACDTHPSHRRAR